MSSATPVIVWFRQDLRRADNPALTAASDSGFSVLPIYILDDGSADHWRMGAASRWWLHQSLMSLDASLDGHLRYFRGDAVEILARLASESGVAGVYWNRCYEPWRIDRDSRAKEKLRESGCAVESFNGSLLFEPQGIAKADGSPYKVFTPFYRKGCLGSATPPRFPLGVPGHAGFYEPPLGQELDRLELISSVNWHQGIEDAGTPGEAGALDRLERFLDDGVRNYKEDRNRPDLEKASRLSPHLHFGEVSPHQVWHAANSVKAIGGLENDIDHFLSELGWREFSNYLLYHWPALPHDNLQRKLDRFPWRDDPISLGRWQRGQTGYPIVDAGMRELWQTGYMHNRVRMIVGSFLVKNLMLHWHHGESWFWDTLVDADLANNSASWQWIAGCGADAAPCFRIFNPVTQGQKFDPNGDYVRRFIPEIAQLSGKFLHSPWEAPEVLLAEAGIELGADYPHPIVDLGCFVQQKASGSSAAAPNATREGKQNPMQTIAELSGRYARPGRLEWIGLRTQRRGTVTSVQAVELLQDRGLEGDHCADKIGGRRQVTLIQWEHLAVIAGLCGEASVAPERLRRNLAVSGINLSSLRASRFRLGEALLEGTGHCPPCSRMERELGHGGFNAMRGHGGITARVLAGAMVSVGSLLMPAE